MRKKILKIVPILIILILGILTIKVNASYRSNDPTVESGGTFSITISSTEKIENFDANLTGYSGLTFVSCSGVDNTVIVNNGKLSGATIGGYTTLGTYTFKAPEVTEKKTFKVSFNINGTTNTSTVTVNPKTVTPPPTTTQPPSTTEKPSEKPTTPKVTSVQGKYTDVNETVYATGSINVRKYDSTEDGSSVVGTLKKDEAIVRTGVGNNGWSRVQYKGAVAYISSRLLTKTAPQPEEPQNNTNTVANTISNEITNTISNEITTNTITNEVGIVDENFDDSAILKLKSLKIKGADISSVFSPDIYEYKIHMETGRKLEIEAIANQSDATVEILGNEDFEGDENLVTIILKSADGSQTCTYQIIVTLGEVSEQTNSENEIDIMYIALAVIIGLIIVITIVIIVLKVRARKNEDDLYDEENTIFNYDKEVGINEEDDDDKRKKGKHF